MWDWLHRARELAAGGPYVIVTVAEAAGSAPRGAGTKMLVSDTELYGTIGGGNLEFTVVDQARKFLESDEGDYQFQKYALGPLLEQCCGGSVVILLERIEPGAEFLMEARHGVLETRFENGVLIKEWVDRSVNGPISFHDKSDRRVEKELSTAALMRESVARNFTPLYMFGAGHVGRAVAAALAPLPFDVVWVDSRASEFPETVPVNHDKRVTEDCVAVVDEVRAGAFYLIFTHSHQLDYELTAKILARGDAAYCGLIGSKTKRARFENRLLRERVLTEDRLGELTCPIGIPGITGKEPEVIAASVAAQLLAVAGSL